ncbi:MAG: hypothetical protein ACOYM2_19905 [Rectinemataceae bacterium]
MKRNVFLPAIIATLAFVVSPLAFGDETFEVYRNIYHDSRSLQDKSAALRNLIALEDRGVAPILAEAFVDLLNSQKAYKESSEKALYCNTLRFVSASLGDYKYGDAAVFLWQAVEQIDDPLVRAECLMSLGKVHATDYAEKISLLLRNLNMGPSVGGAEGGEKIAYASIISLGDLKDIRGFSPVFFASQGWYSQRVRSQALRSLKDITEDPTDVVQVILWEEDPVKKCLALELELASKASTERKVASAVFGLSCGHAQYDANQKTEAKDFSKLRKVALTGLIQLRGKSVEAVPLEYLSYVNGFDEEERILGLLALGVNGVDSAAVVISNLLMGLNTDVMGGVSDVVRNRMVKAAIEAAASSKNPIVRPALASVQNNMKWSNSIIIAAKGALDGFGSGK